MSPPPAKLRLLRQQRRREGETAWSVSAGSVIPGRGRTTMQGPTVEFAALARVLPVSLVRETLVECGREAKRRRKLPPELVTWLVVGMGLYRSLSIPCVLEQIGQALGDALGWGRAERPHATSI